MAFQRWSNFQNPSINQPCFNVGFQRWFNGDSRSCARWDALQNSMYVLNVSPSSIFKFIIIIIDIIIIILTSHSHAYTVSVSGWVAHSITDCVSAKLCMCLWQSVGDCDSHVRLVTLQSALTLLLLYSPPYIRSPNEPLWGWTKCETNGQMRWAFEVKGHSYPVSELSTDQLGPYEYSSRSSTTYSC